MNRPRIRNWFLPTLLAVDILVLSASFWTGFWVRFYSQWIRHPAVPPLHWYGALLALSLVVHLLVFKYAGLYRQRHGIHGVDEFRTIFNGVSISFLILLAISFFFREFSFSRLMLAITWGLNILLLAFSRSVFRRAQLVLRRRGLGITRCLIVGTGPAARSLYERLRSNRGYGYRVMGFIDPGQRPSGRITGLRVLGRIGRLPRLIRDLEIEEVLVIASAPVYAEIMKIFQICREQDAEVKLIPEVFQLITAPVSVDDIEGLPVFGLREEPLSRPVNRFLKRTMDIALSGLGLVLFSWLYLLIALLIKLETQGPVFYKQVRVGRDNRTFLIYKFRSMTVGAERASGPVWARRDDARRTRVGSVLRRTSLDEIPQLINVLKGDMSLVGPRPERPYFVDQFKREVPRYLERHKVRAGITGWAQVNGLRGNTSIEDRIKHDIFYIENWSVLFDVSILVRTALDLFEHKHAY